MGFARAFYATAAYKKYGRRDELEVMHYTNILRGVRVVEASVSEIPQVYEYFQSRRLYEFRAYLRYSIGCCYEGYYGLYYTWLVVSLTAENFNFLYINGVTDLDSERVDSWLPPIVTPAGADVGPSGLRGSDTRPCGRLSRPCTDRLKGIHIYEEITSVNCSILENNRNIEAWVSLTFPNSPSHKLRRCTVSSVSLGTGLKLLPGIIALIVANPFQFPFLNRPRGLFPAPREFTVQAFHPYITVTVYTYLTSPPTTLTS